MSVLTVIDTTGIQNYIFGSNRLRENIGASEIVARATDEWVKACLRHEGQWKTNVDDETLELKRDSLDAERIYAGGGNTLILFKDRATAKEFTKRYTKFLLENAPGLSVVVAHSKEFEIGDNDNCVIRDQREEVMKRINEKKANRELSAPLLGMAVTAKCASTGVVASFYPAEAAPEGSEERKTLEDKYGYNYISAESLVKLKYVQAANDRLKRDLLGDNPRWLRLSKAPYRLEVPYELDNLGRSEGEASYIAVVHTDGNGMGKRVELIGHGKDVKTSRDWINKMRSFSKEINNANLRALKMTLAHLLERIQERMDETGNNKLIVNGGHGEEFELSSEDRKIDGVRKFYKFLPFRPLVFGGEDGAFVCDGRIALALTAYYLDKTESEILPDGSGLYSRAGIAIVKSHHPFARAYSLAEDLARSAKKRVREVSSVGEASALDWHLAMTGLAGDVQEIRGREYMTKDERELNMRPLFLKHTPLVMQGWRSYEAFKDILRHFLKPEWLEKRNKVKALRDALREGEQSVKNFVKLYRLKKLPNIKDYPNVGESGWEGDVCTWFDAIEMLDLFYPLEEIEDESEAQEGTGAKAQEEGQAA